MNILKDKVAVITGASRGIGLAIARTFQAQGARLSVSANKSYDQLAAYFPEALTTKLDLADTKSVLSLVDETLRRFGRIDILVCNAAIFRQQNFEDISEEDLHAFININFISSFLLVQKVFSEMKKDKQGKIIMISSGAAKLGSSRAMHYAASKAALISLTKSLAKLAGMYNINVNAVAPGFIDTDMTEDMLTKRREAIELLIPLKRVGVPNDVANLALFLASEDSGYITGQTICVDGGHCLI